MDKITLINTSSVNLGIRSISAYLKQEGYQTQCLFLEQPETSEYADKTLEDLGRLCEDTKIIGISGLRSTNSRTNQIISYLKQKSKIIICGGYDATLSPESYPLADYVCIGDGEKAMLDLVREIESGRPPQDKILPIKPIYELGGLPAEDYNKKSHFALSDSGQIIQLEGLLEYKQPRVNTINTLFYVAARGCPNRCSYCQADPFFQKANLKNRVRIKPYQKVIKEIKSLKEKYPELEKICFVEPDFFIKPTDWLNKFSREYARYIALPFWAFGSPLTVNQKKLDLLVDMGLREIQIGVESGSERTRSEKFNRKYSNQQIKDVVSLCLEKENLDLSLDILYDVPFESQMDLLDTINLINDLPKPFKLGSFALNFLPGTVLDKKYKGKFSKENIQKNYLNTKVKHKQNIYLNSLIRLMGGECTDKCLGIIPVSAIPILTSLHITDFMEQNPEFASALDLIIKSDLEIVFKKDKINSHF